MRKRLKKKESENISKNKNYVLGTESKESVEIYGETLEDEILESEDGFFVTTYINQPERKEDGLNKRSS